METFVLKLFFPKSAEKSKEKIIQESTAFYF